MPAVSLAGSDDRRAYDACAFCTTWPGLGCERRGSLYAPTPACFELFFNLPTCVVELLLCSFSHALPMPTPGPGLHLAWQVVVHRRGLGRVAVCVLC